MRLRDKVAIVTGGGTGIGKAISMAFASEGATVVVAARDVSRLEEAATEINSQGGRATAVTADVTDEKQVQRMVTRTLDEHNQIDILVNNSGIAGPTAYVVDIDLERWNEVLAINLTGAMLCAREALRSMIPRRNGNIINISSTAGIAGYPMRSPYCVSKWGIIGLTETLAIEVGEYNIRVNCISPAGVKGERNIDLMKAKAKALGVSHEEVVRRALSKYSLKRIVEPSEVAAAAVFLASDDASAITGHNFVVNCGFHLFS
jgi:NAD(P)-dependent dehydrogenase (short-subunit alcohol dehydrogenase family)